ncbi:MAG TPA: PEP-CTERM sorting domain-containing protein, partial [Verrucomicrobiae bacterium]|nr:PEP-CTERM sorting domain-containing protein [Verrucomicrobiae bacterium]
NANIDEFGWYDIADPSVLHPIFGGSDSPITNATFSPSLEYGFYLKRDNDNETFYTQSELNPYKDTLHQHFVVFEESLTPSNDVYWIGIEDSTRLELKGKEGGLGDYNDMLIEIGVSSPAIVPEPSTIMLVLTGTLLLVGIRYRNRR